MNRSKGQGSSAAGVKPRHSQENTFTTSHNQASAVRPLPRWQCCHHHHHEHATCHVSLLQPPPPPLSPPSRSLQPFYECPSSDEPLLIDSLPVVVFAEATLVQALGSQS